MENQEYAKHLKYFLEVGLFLGYNLKQGSKEPNKNKVELILIFWVFCGILIMWSNVEERG